MDTVKGDDVLVKQNQDMQEFLHQYPVEEYDLDQKLTQMEENICAIRSHLEDKQPRKRVTIAQVDEKIDLILKLLTHK